MNISKLNVAHSSKCDREGSYMQTFSQDFISDPDILKQLLILKTDILILGTNLVQNTEVLNLDLVLKYLLSGQCTAGP
jgi:hypothetical protein